MAVAVLFTTSCAKEDISSSIANGETVEVTFTANLTSLGTRAEFGGGAQVNTLRYFVFDAEGNFLSDELNGVTNISVNAPATVNLPLIKGMTYNILFWADCIENDIEYYSINKQTGVVSINSEVGINANDEKRDAFYSIVTNFNPATATSEDTKVELRRPFAQLNAISNAEDLAALANSHVVLSTSAISAEVYTTLDPFASENEQLSNKRLVKFAADNNPDTTNGHLSMNYIFAPVNGCLADVTFTFNNSNDGVQSTTTTYTNIPLQRNYKTNIIGKLLTKSTEFEVTIDANWTTPEYEVAVWDGKTVTAPTYDEQTKTYTVTNGAELAWIAAAANGTTRGDVNTFIDQTIVLANDIYLDGQEWTPIGTSANPFKGTFDGQGHIIKNLVVSGYNSNAGLFGFTTDGEVKNLTVQDAKVSGRLNVGVVAGQPYTTKYTNITVKGHIEVNGMAYVGGVGGKNAYADWTNITVNADETSYVKANSVENGTAYRTYVGGVVGFNGEGGHTFSNISSNIAVEGSTIDVGGLFGIAHYDNKFENCVCTGNVTITTDEVENALEMGGIAGVWHNQNGTTVTMTNCSFTGELYTPNITEEVAFCYGGLVGAPYSATGTGKLIIDGAVVVNSVAEFVALAKADIEAGGTELAYTALGANVGSLDGTNFVPAGVTVTLRDAKVTGISRNNSAYGTLVFDNCSFSNNSAYSINFIGGNGHVVFNNCELVGWCSFGSVTVEMNNCSVAGNGKYALVRSYNTFAMNNCTINCTNTNTSDNYHDGVSIGGGAVMTMTGCTMTNAGYEYGEAADQKTMDYSSYILVDGKRLACNQDSLVAAMKNGDAILMENDVTVNGSLKVAEAKNKVVDINGNGHTLTTGMVNGQGVNGITMSNMTLVGSNPNNFTFYANSGKVVMTNVTVSSNFNQAVCLGGGGEVVLTNCNISGTPNSDEYHVATIWCGDGRNVTINGGKYSSIFMNAQYHQDWIDNGWVNPDDHATTHAASKITLNDGTISKLTLETELGAEGYYTSATLVQNGGTIETLVENPAGCDLTGRELYVK